MRAGAAVWLWAAVLAGAFVTVVAQTFDPPFLRLGNSVLGLVSVSRDDLPQINEALETEDLSNLVAFALFSPPGSAVLEPWAIPTELGRVSSLVILFAQAIVGGTIPSQLGLLNNLQSLSLPDTTVRGTLPSQLGRLSKLNDLGVYANSIEGTIPSQLGRLTRLLSLRLQLTALSGSVPSELGLLTALETLYLFRTDLSGAVPTQLGALTNLKDFRIGFNDLSGGEFPLQLLTATSLQVVDTSFARMHTSFDGHIFPNATSVEISYTTLESGWRAFGDPDALIRLQLESCALQGTVPSQVGLLTTLQTFRVSHNQLSGTLPSQLGLLSALTSLRVADNVLTGVPSELALLSVSLLDLGSNLLSGTVPRSLLQGQLTVLILGANDLQGSIPTQIGASTLLAALYVNDNRLSGALPTQLGLLSRLTTLAIHGNAFSGAVPVVVQTLPALQTVVIARNALEGKITVGDHDVWLEACDDSGLDEEACDYSCAGCGAWEVELVACDWKGRGQVCGNVVGVVVGACAVVVLSVAMHGKMAKCLGFRFVVLVFRSVFAVVKSFLDALFVLGTSGLVSHLALGSLVIPAALKFIAALVFVVPHHNQGWNWVVACAVVMAAFDGGVFEPALQLSDKSRPPQLLGALLALSIAESMCTVTVQFFEVQSGGASDSLIAAFVFSVLSFAALVIVFLVLVLSHARARFHWKPASSMELGAVVDDNSVSPEADSASMPTRPALLQDGSEEEGGKKGCNEEEGGKKGGGEEGGKKGGGEEGGEEGGDPLISQADPQKGEPEGELPAKDGTEKQTRSRQKWLAVLACCCVCAGLAFQPEPRERGQAVVHSSSLPPDLLLTPPGPLPRGDAGTALAPRVSSKADPICPAGFYSASGPVICVLGNLFGLIETFGELDSPLGSLIALGDLATAQFLVLTTERVLPCEIGTLSNLRALMASVTAPLPTELGLLSALQFLDLDKHITTAPLPSEIAQLTQLNMLRLRNSKFHAIPSQWGVLSALRTLEVEDVDLLPGATVPTQLGGLGNLTSVLLHEGRMQGPLPSELGCLTHLAEVLLESNGFEEELPTELGLLRGVRILDARSNAFTGGAASFALQIPALEFIDLSSNRLTGSPFPNSWTPPPLLRTLDVQQNNLSGTVPTQIGLATHLQHLSLAFNSKLGGTLPTQLGLLTLLTHLGLEACDFEGQLPAQLSALTNLESVAIAHNSLGGKLPQAFNGLQRALWLGGCDYSGLSNIECRQYCPPCAVTQLRVRGCDPRGHHYVCLPFYVMVLLVGLLGFVMRVTLRRITVARAFDARVVLELVVSAVSAMHTVLNVLFVVDQPWVLLIVGTGVMLLTMLFRLVIVVDEFLFLQSHGHVSIIQKYNVLSLALLFCLVDPSTVEAFVAGERSKREQFALVRVKVLFVFFTLDIPMFFLQTIAVAMSSEAINVQALCLTAVSLGGALVVAMQTRRAYGDVLRGSRQRPAQGSSKPSSPNPDSGRGGGQ